MSSAARPGDLDDLPEGVRRYIERLEDDAKRRSQWSPQTWIALASFVGMLLVSVFAVGARWNGVDALSERIAKVETKLESDRAQADSQYARRDLIDQRLQTLSSQVNDLQLDIRDVKSSLSKK